MGFKIVLTLSAAVVYPIKVLFCQHLLKCYEFPLLQHRRVYLLPSVP